MEERAACAQLKRRFEAAGFRIKENQTFDERGVRFEMDGFDAERRVGYEYVTAEAGDGWDVDGDVIAALAERRKRGEIHVFIIDEEDAPDAASLDQAIDAFLAGLPSRAAEAPAPHAEAPAAPTDESTDESIDEPIDEIEPEPEEPDAPSSAAPGKVAPPRAPPARAAASKPAAKSTRPPPTPKAAKKKPARKPK